jgi:hypothetical protein
MKGGKKKMNREELNSAVERKKERIMERRESNWEFERKLDKIKDDISFYGICPCCGSSRVSRQITIYGNATCDNCGLKIHEWHDDVNGNHIVLNQDSKINPILNLPGGKIYRRRGMIRTPGDTCFIATEVYGDRDAPEVKALRTYRDNTLRKNWLGRGFIEFYYSGFGKKTAHLIGKFPFTKKAIRRGLNLFVERISQ